MAEQPKSVEFVTVVAEDILSERQQDWSDFTRFTTRAVIIVAVVLILLLLFVV